MTVVICKEGCTCGRHKSQDERVVVNSFTEPHHLVFLAHYGPFPHPCHFCQETVRGYTYPNDVRAAVVHHCDGDHTNNAPANLVPAHNGCHVSYHNSGERNYFYGKKFCGPDNGFYGKKHDADTRAKMSKPRSYMPPKTDEHKAKIGDALRGRVRLNQRGKPKPRACCLVCHRELGVNGIPGHLRTHS